MNIIRTFLAIACQAIVLTLLAPSVVSAANASGFFHAEKACALFQSKKKQTNPGDLRSQAGQSYVILEALPTVRNADWYRVKVVAARTPRWISAECGAVKRSAESSTARQQTGRSPCRTPNQHDSHILALTWQPAFCETKNNRPGECKRLGPRSHTAKNFSLHGLWPNRQQCGRDYAFCGQVKAQQPFCAYPKLPLRDDLRTEMEQIMPNAALPNGCLQRHEYWKHGSCRDSDPNDYFTLATRLTTHFNESVFVTRFMQSNAGNRVATSKLLQAFDQSFGTNAHKRLQLQCAKEMLVEIRITLPRALGSGNNLEDLIRRGTGQRNRGQCPDSIRIDTF